MRIPLKFILLGLALLAGRGTAEALSCPEDARAIDGACWIVDPKGCQPDDSCWNQCVKVWAVNTWPASLDESGGPGGSAVSSRAAEQLERCTQAPDPMTCYGQSIQTTFAEAGGISGVRMPIRHAHKGQECARPVPAFAPAAEGAAIESEEARAQLAVVDVEVKDTGHNIGWREGQTPPNLGGVLIWVVPMMFIFGTLGMVLLSATMPPWLRFLLGAGAGIAIGIGLIQLFLDLGIFGPSTTVHVEGGY